MVRILCIADEVDSLVYSPNIRQRFKDVDFVLAAGDLPLKYQSYVISMLNKPLYFVFGNHHLKHLDDYRPHGASTFKHAFRHQDSGGHYVGGRVVQDSRSRLLIAGLGGCRRYNRGENQFTEGQMLLRMLALLPRLLLNRIFRGRYLDILLTHAPPAGIHDRLDLCHQGFKIFRWMLRTFKPRYMIHGHVHLLGINERPKSSYHQTTIINVYSHYVLELPDPKCRHRSKAERTTTTVRG